MIKIAVNGIMGRMGQEIVQALEKSDQFHLMGGIDTRQSQINPDLHVYTDPDKILPVVDVVIDFSLPAGAEHILDACLVHRKPLVAGTTGMDEKQMKKYEEASQTIPIVQTFNFSIGINLLLRMVRQTAEVLQDKADIEIVESHHRMKKDSPSGTALLLARHIARQLQRPEQATIRFGRSGKELKREEEISIHSLRGGSVVGEHQVYFLGMNENLIFTHQAQNRKVFVDGALLAAEWITHRQTGLYSMEQVLGV